MTLGASQNRSPTHRLPHPLANPATHEPVDLDVSKVLPVKTLKVGNRVDDAPRTSAI